MKKTAILFLGLFIGLCSCNKLLYEGIVVEKIYTPALTYGQYGPPYDEYKLKIEAEIDSELIKSTVEVSKQTFDSIDVGDIYPIIE
jgi:hypothetical protein